MGRDHNKVWGTVEEGRDKRMDGCFINFLNGFGIRAGGRMLYNKHIKATAGTLTIKVK